VADSRSRGRPAQQTGGDGGAGMSANGKPKFAMYWAAACGGCEIAVLNIHEKILDVDANFEVVFWPVAMDAKYKDVEAMPDQSITLCLFNGALRNSENVHVAELLRRKAKILVAFGSCACEGGFPALANLSTVQEALDTAFFTPSTDNPKKILPQQPLRKASWRSRRSIPSCDRSIWWCRSTTTCRAALPSRNRSRPSWNW
jgi:Ni,Fe-hydrogenase III small subunit